MTLKIISPFMAIAEEVDGDFKLSAVLVDKVQTGENEWHLQIHDSSPCGRGDGKLHLYQVILSDNTTHYCLAESEKGAIGQCSCAPSDKVSYEAQKALEEGAVAIKLPFRCRGWAGSVF